MRVLLVEDDELVRLILAEMLGDAGMSVAEAPDAERALAHTAAPPAVLVSDVDLGPGMDGVALAAEARRRWPGLRVVLVSGLPTNRARCRPGVADRFLAKPVTGAALVAAVGEVVDAGGRGLRSTNA